jgi:hypothetical protein
VNSRERDSSTKEAPPISAPPMNELAKIGGIVWLAVSAVVFIVNELRGRACRSSATIGRFPRTCAISHTPSNGGATISK